MTSSSDTPQARLASSGAQVRPIQPDDLAQVGRFLHENLNRRFSAERWIQSLTHPWSADAPNFGMQLVDDGRLVGVFCAIYSEQFIRGRVERFCNPHSWCVLESHRRHGIGLILQLVRQRDYHFTMFTPNPKVAEVFRGLKFKDLSARQWVFANLPSPMLALPGRFAVSTAAEIEQRLSGQALKDFEAHRSIPWLRFAAFGHGADACLVIYKAVVWKRAPCAWLMHLSDAGVFARHAGLLRSHLLLSHGFATSRIEARWLAQRPPFAWPSVRTQPKLFLSKSLGDGDIRDVYSELMSLDV